MLRNLRSRKKKDVNSPEDSKKCLLSQRNDNKVRKSNTRKTPSMLPATSVKKEQPRKEASAKKQSRRPEMLEFCIDLTGDSDSDKVLLLQRRSTIVCSRSGVQNVPLGRQNQTFFQSLKQDKDEDVKPVTSVEELPHPVQNPILQTGWSFSNLNRTEFSKDDVLPGGGLPFPPPITDRGISVAPSPTQTTEERMNIEEELRRLHAEAESERSRADQLEEGLDRIRGVHREELEKLHKEAAKEQQIRLSLLEQHDAAISEMLHGKQTQHQSLLDAGAERDKLRDELGDAGDQMQDLARERDEIQDKLQLEQNKTGTMQAEIASLQAALKKEQYDHSELMKTLDAYKTASSSSSSSDVALEELASLRAINLALHKDMEAFKATTAAAATRAKSPLSLAPSSIGSAFASAWASSSSSDDLTKLENVRKTYVKVKRRFDALHAVAQDIAMCTRSMDPSNFGDFGGHLRRLWGVLEEFRGEVKGKGLS